MVDYITIGGESRPVRFGMNALRIYSLEYNIPLAKVGFLSKQTNLGELIGLYFCGFRDGARAEKKDFQFTVEDVSDWFDLDNSLLEQMMVIYIRQYAGNPPSPAKPGI